MTRYTAIRKIASRLHESIDSQIYNMITECFPNTVDPAYTSSICTERIVSDIMQELDLYHIVLSAYESE